ncbi:hypothetical protein [Nitrospirillum iridis]|uniref:Uncharacterized protein n=1 Tax=Nitrospirillum iridis TaxID=765888 RepID=A0A7X0AZC0_9PROT|nr:hypothetical protein [Nitrospirillum iridis]MBB6251451.1 hypothetical protein [Nitrospirillum iridis]
MTDAHSGPRGLITAVLGILPWMASGFIVLHHRLTKGKAMIDPNPQPAVSAPAPIPLVGEAGPELVSIPAGTVGAPPSVPPSPGIGDLAAQLAAARDEYRDAVSADAQARLAATAAAQGKADAYATLTAAKDTFDKAATDLMGTATDALGLGVAPS